jgi:hypothetical protein
MSLTSQSWTHAAFCRARAALEEAVLAEELEPLLSEYVEGLMHCSCLTSQHCAHAAVTAFCRARAALEESLVAEELERLLSEYVEGRVKDVLASEHVQASLAARLAVSVVTDSGIAHCSRSGFFSSSQMGVQVQMLCLSRLEHAL